MKRIILILIGLVVFNIANAQISFKENDTYKTYLGVAGDTLNGSYLLTKSIFVGDKDYAYDYYIQVEADSLGDGTDITCRLRGSMDGSTWTNIGDAITWGVTDSDTTIVYSSLTRSSAISSTLGSYTSTQPTFTYYADSVASDSTRYVIPQVVTTVGAQTVTTTESYQDGVAWRYLQVYFLGGGAGADMELEAIRVRILKTQ